MKRIDNIHNKTKEIDSINLPYNNKNVLLNDENLRELFDTNGLKGLKYKNINLYRVAFVHKSYCTMKNIDFNKSNINCPSDCLPLQDVSYERLEFFVLAPVKSAFTDKTSTFSNCEFKTRD